LNRLQINSVVNLNLNMPQPVDFKSCCDHLRKILETELIPKRSFSDPGMKVIHDPLWGSRLFYPWEIALLDTPLLQRLRRIYQLGTAYLTYPSGVHNRFSHSLGVTVLAGRLINRLVTFKSVGMGRFQSEKFEC